MLGRSGCLLVFTFLLFAPRIISGQEVPAARFPQHLPVEPPLVHPPLHTVYLPRLPVTSPGMYGFPQFVRAAGMIFSGTVTNIEWHAATLGQSVETVAVTFHVDKAIRGATPGQNLTISQWVGLWASGQRYRVGERVVVFLYPKSKLGLTSWVGGPMGHFAIDATGRVVLTAQHVTAFRKDPVLGGKPRARISDFARAVRQANAEE